MRIYTLLRSSFLVFAAGFSNLPYALVVQLKLIALL